MGLSLENFHKKMEQTVGRQQKKKERINGEKIVSTVGLVEGGGGKRKEIVFSHRWNSVSFC